MEPTSASASTLERIGNLGHQLATARLEAIVFCERAGIPKDQEQDRLPVQLEGEEAREIPSGFVRDRASDEQGRVAPRLDLLGNDSEERAAGEGVRGPHPFDVRGEEPPWRPGRIVHVDETPAG